MTRPEIVRADTLDLQSHDSPSAKDHSRQPSHPAPLGLGPPAPHQSLSLKHAENETLQEQQSSPRASEEQMMDHVPSEDHDYYEDSEQLVGNGQLVHQDVNGTYRQRAEEEAAMAGGYGNDEETLVGDQEGDDEDMMDKISSSPSIDDGVYPLPPLQSNSTNTPGTSPQSPLSDSSSSPYTMSPRHLPLSVNESPVQASPMDGSPLASSDHHQPEGGFGNQDLLSDAPDLEFQHRPNKQEDQKDTDIPTNIRNFLLPDHDELLIVESDAASLTDDDSTMDNSSDADSVDDMDINSTQQIPLLKNEQIFYGRPTWVDDDPWEGEGDDSLYDDDPQYVSYGWHPACLQLHSEDIDFEFVYALHTFVATVEGQANCTKGDTMVLLDDSNSYWWLVRVVKDGSIGYLPAEHIETPTERLARLNKHRNIDLAQTMLGDNPEKSKNPLKKAMKRRNAKTVQFAAPTYVEPSDVEYLSDEEGGDQPLYSNQVEGQDNQAASDTIEPLKLKSSDGGLSLDQQNGSSDDLASSPERSKSLDEPYDKQDNSSPRSRNGVLRNTDSFFRDDSTETRKISLTPNLLRDDSGKDSSEKDRVSLDTFDKIVSPMERGKDDKRRKEKKPGMLSGLFKRKDRKSRTTDDDIDEPEKSSEDSLRKESSDSSTQDSRSSKSTPALSPQRQPSKLQKAPPPELSPVRTTGFQTLDSQGPSNNTRVSPSGQDNAPTLRKVDPESQEDGADVPPKSNPFSDDANVETRHQRFAIDDFGGDEQRNATPTQQQIDDRLSESPVQVSPIDPNPPQHPPELTHDTSSVEDHVSHSPISPASSTEIVDPENQEQKSDVPTPASTATSSAPTPTWSDASLRQYIDDEQNQDITDLITIVKDVSSVQPVGPDHPIIGTMYKDERKKLAELNEQLDMMHRHYLDRRGIRY